MKTIEDPMFELAKQTLQEALKIGWTDAFNISCSDLNSDEVTRLQNYMVPLLETIKCLFTDKFKLRKIENERKKEEIEPIEIEIYEAPMAQAN